MACRGPRNRVPACPCLSTFRSGLPGQRSRWPDHGSEPVRVFLRHQQQLPCCPDAPVRCDMAAMVGSRIHDVKWYFFSNP